MADLKATPTSTIGIFRTAASGGLSEPKPNSRWRVRAMFPQSELAGRCVQAIRGATWVHDLTVTEQLGGVVLQGRCSRYYQKKDAQDIVREIVGKICTISNLIRVES